MNDRNRAFVLILAMAVLAAFSALPVLAQEVPSGPPACPLTEGIVLNAAGEAWDISFIRSDRSFDDAVRVGTGAIPAGRYKVVLAAWDDHGEGDQTQLNEQWLLEGLVDGSVVFTSGATPDIADDAVLVVATVNADVEVPAFTDLRAVHAAWRNRETPNSVYPLCASFVPVPDVADLSVTLVDSADPVMVGDNFDYDLTVTNAGPEAATGVVATLALPAESAFVSAPAGCVHSGEASDGTVTCAVGDLAVDGSVAIPITVQALTAGETPAVATGSATGNEVDPDLTNNQASEETTIEALPVPQADLAVTVTMPDNSLDLGEEQAVFDLVVTNNGPDSGTVVVSLGTLPPGFTLVSATSPESTCTEAAGVVSCDFGSMANGETGTISIVAEPSTFGSFVFGASVSSATADPDLTNNVAEIAFDVVNVLPQVITTTTSTTTTSTTVATTSETLPFTGSSTAGAGGLATGLILMGGLVLLVGNSRRRYEAKHR